MMFTRTMNITKPLPAALLLVLLPACSTLTLEELVAMDTQSRANLVCVHNDQVNANKQQLSDTQVRIDEIDAIINKGYRRVESCAVTTVTVSKEICEQVADADTGKTTTQCSIVKTPAISEDCKQVDVPASENYKQQQRHDLKAKWTLLSQQHQQALGACIQKVSPMTPEEAYRYHKGN